MTDVCGKYRVALVRNVWSYFYLKPPSEEWKEQIHSSIHHHVGLVGLWTQYKTDLITVDDGLWTQRIALEAFYMGDASCPDTLSRLAHTRRWAVRSSNVDWDQYDIVVCLDSVVPRSVMRRHTRPLWTIFLTTPSPSLYLLRTWLPMYGFQVAWIDQVVDAGSVQASSTEDLESGTRPFPLSFFKSEDLLRLSQHEDDQGIRGGGKRGIHLEKHCAPLLTEEEWRILRGFGPVTHSVPRAEYFPTMAARKYFVVSHGNIRYLKGHSLIEANGFGCLILVRRGARMEFSKLVSGDMTFGSFAELVERIRMYESDPIAFARQLARQQKRLDDYAFHNPQRMLDWMISRHKAKGPPATPWWASARDVFITSAYPVYWMVAVPLYRAAFWFSNKVFGKDLVSVISECLHAGRTQQL